jgi:hypothetical protein
VPGAGRHCLAVDPVRSLTEEPRAAPGLLQHAGDALFGAGFFGADISLDGVRFLGGMVDFSRARDWSVPPSFPGQARGPDA